MTKKKDEVVEKVKKPKTKAIEPISGVEIKTPENVEEVDNRGVIM